jgi:hypothetical protein
MISTWLRPLSSRSLRRPASAKPKLERYEDRIVPSFTPTVYPLPSGGTGPNGIATGDLRGLGQGMPDMVTANRNSDNVSVFLNDGSGGYLPPVNYPAGTSPTSLAIGDLNGDGLPDIVVRNYGLGATGTNATVLFNNPAAPGTFGAPVTVQVGDDEGGHVAVASLLGDGVNDFVFGNFSTAPLGSVSVVLQDRNNPGQFLPPVLYQLPAQPGGMPPGSSGYAVAVADINGDGIPDIVAPEVYHSTSVVYVLYGNDDGTGHGDGTFGPFVRVGTTPGFATGLVAGDIDGSGNASIVTANNTANSISVLLNTGGGTFAAPVTLPAGNVPKDLALGQVAGSGLPDVVTANFGHLATDVSLFYNDPNNPGHFLPAISLFTSGMEASGVAIDDHDGDNATDGLLDIFTSNSGSNNVTVLDHNLDLQPGPGRAPGSGSQGAHSLWAQEAAQYGTVGGLSGHDAAFVGLADASRVLQFQGRSGHHGFGSDDN